MTSHIPTKKVVTKDTVIDALRAEAKLRLTEIENLDKASLLASKEPVSNARLLHELQVHQVELEMQQKELISARNLAETLAENFESLYDLAPVGYISLDNNGHITQLNLTAAKMLATPRSKAKGKRLAAFLTQDSLPVFNLQLANVYEGVLQNACDINLLVDNNICATQMRLHLNTDSSECLTILTDINDHKKAQVKLQLAASVFSYAHEGIMITDVNGSILDVNDTFTKITGYTREEVIGKNPHILKSGRHTQDFYVNMWESLKNNGYWSSEVLNKRKNGEIYPEMQSISAVHDVLGKVMHYVSMFTDITDSKAHQQQLEHTAHHDMLTGLPNRALLAKKLEQAIKQSQRHSKTLAVAYLDLDGFKGINDSHGHSTGDQFLIAMSKLFNEALRAGDFLARIGGDEFVVVLCDLDKASDCEPVLERILLAASQKILCNEEIVTASTSIGVTFYPQNGVDPDLLLRQADQAMYQAKDAGKSCYRFFDIKSEAVTRSRRESLERIRQAFEQNEFVLYFQPKVNMSTNAVVGTEALIRWQHPQKGLLLPCDFLPIIEDHSISIKLGEWVVDTALKQIKTWQAQGLVMPVSVNIGASQLLSSHFVTDMAKALASYPEVLPELLELEVLETCALEDMLQVSEIMNSCLKLGIHFALDDFGTGYSSLTYLKRFPTTVLKIDQSFVLGMLAGKADMAIVKAVIGMAEAFNREVIAEGVETKKLGDKLLSLNCSVAQGNGIAFPMPEDELPLWVERWNKNPIWVA
jgi:diguanylate cyclase (GGDEF)-like protein/PAS domain S-box-containing protein